MIYQPSKERLIRALEERFLPKILKIGRLSEPQVEALNKIRELKGWPSRGADGLTISPGYINHILKRIDTDGMAPAMANRLVGMTAHVGYDHLNEIS